MTSRRSYTNLRRENIKHRIGMIFITLFFFFLSMLAFLMAVQNICSQDDETEKILGRITALAQPEFGMSAVAVGAAVLLAISSFKYLHVKMEVDLYHSLPIRRRELLYILLTDDLALFAVPLVLVAAFRCIVTAAVGYLSPAFLINSFWAIVCYTAIFAVTYLTMSLAMLMTGNTFIGFLGFCVFSEYSPIMLGMLYPALASTFFKTYCEVGDRSALFNYFSPLSLASMLVSGINGWKWEEHIVTLAVMGVWIVVLTVLNYLLFDRRASEMAGRAMAFPKWNPVIRFLLVVPSAIYVGLGFYALSFTSFRLWIVAGIVIGGFFIHGVIECIYRFDVRGLWSNKRQMLASIAVAFLITGFFWLDLSGFDTYMPKEEELSSVVMDNAITADDSFWGKERKGLTGDTMKKTLAVLEKVVGENDRNKEISDKNGTRGYDPYIFTYRLKNGKTAKRKYTFSPELKDELMSQVFDTMEYKKDTYSLYTADWSLVTDVEISYPIRIETLDLTKEQRSELLRIYLEEHAGLDYKTVRSTIPFGQLTIAHKFERTPEGFLGDVEASEYYHLYPSFKKTIKYLREELGVDVKTSMKDVPVTSISVSRYSESKDTWESFDIYDEEFISSIKEDLFYADCLWIDEIEQAVDLSVDLSVTVKTETGEESYGVYTDADTVEKIKKQGTFE